MHKNTFERKTNTHIINNEGVSLEKNKHFNCNWCEHHAESRMPPDECNSSANEYILSCIQEVI